MAKRRTRTHRKRKNPVVTKCKVCKKGITQKRGPGRPRTTHERCKSNKTPAKRKTITRKTVRKKTQTKKTSHKKTAARKTPVKKDSTKKPMFWLRDNYGPLSAKDQSRGKFARQKIRMGTKKWDDIEAGNYHVVTYGSESLPAKARKFWKSAQQDGSWIAKIVGSYMNLVIWTRSKVEAREIAFDITGLIPWIVKKNKGEAKNCALLGWDADEPVFKKWAKKYF